MDKKIKGFYFDFMPLGQAIKRARVARQITREKLAEEAGYAPRHIQAIENDGQFPSVELLIWLARKFDISIDQYVFPKREAKKSTVRRQVETKLDKLTDRELSIIDATAVGICNAREPEV